MGSSLATDKIRRNPNQISFFFWSSIGLFEIGVGVFQIFGVSFRFKSSFPVPLLSLGDVDMSSFDRVDGGLFLEPSTPISQMFPHFCFLCLEPGLLGSPSDGFSFFPFEDFFGFLFSLSLPLFEFLLDGGFDFFFFEMLSSAGDRESSVIFSVFGVDSEIRVLFLVFL